VGVVPDYLSLYDTFDTDHTRQLKEIFFVAIISFFKRGTPAGELEPRIRENGVIRKTWEDTKKGSPVVRTPGPLGSAGRTRRNSSNPLKSRGIVNFEFL